MNGEHQPSVTITIVTFNSARYIDSCLEFASRQDHPECEIVVVDNASVDETPELLRAAERAWVAEIPLRVFYNRSNSGFAGGQNQAMAAAPESDWILTLNPDVRVAPDFVRELLAVRELDDRIGSICGKLLAVSPDWTIPDPPLLDSTGMFFTPHLRHFDRGQRAVDHGQYEQVEFIVGGTGAACLYRRDMVRDLSDAGQFFDNDFFAYREDADVAWRAQLLGWKCLYTPLAIGYHVRRVTPENRRSLPRVLNMHSVKNRWLLRIKNTTPALYRQFWKSITARDMLVIGGCLLFEWSSLPAFWLVLKLWKGMWRKRRSILGRQRVSDEYMNGWFSDQPVSFPAYSGRRTAV